MAVICAQVQFSGLFEEFQTMAHDALDKWLGGFSPFFEREKPPRLEELSNHFQETIGASRWHAGSHSEAFSAHDRPSTGPVSSL